MSSEAPAAPVSYAFDDVIVDARAHQVTRGGVEVSLEPKAYGVLLALLASAGAAVTRDALLDAVWGHRHVTPAVLNRVIAMLRRALGDDADHPRLIRTVHGTGYSFIAPVRLIDAGVPATVVAALGETASGDRDSAMAPAEALAAAPGAAGAPPPPMIERRAIAPKHRMRAPWLALALGLVALAVISTAWLGRREREGVAPRMPIDAARAPDATPIARRTLAVLPPVIAGDDAADRALAFTYIDGLRDALARFPGVETVGRESARIALLREQQPSKAGAMLGVEHVLRAEFARDGERMGVSLELVRVADHRSVWRKRYEEPREQLFRTISPVLDAVHVVLAAAPRTRDPVLAAAPTAQDAYWRGVIELQLAEPGSPPRAIALFEQALSIDPGFAAAHVGIATAWRAAAFARDVSFEDAAANGRVAVAQALAIDPDLVEAYVAEALLLTMQWRTVEAMAPIRRARAIAPEHSGVLMLAASLATYDGRPRDALVLRERLARLDPLSPLLYSLWARDLIAAGRLDDALAKNREALVIDGDSPFALDGAGRAYAAFGRFADAIETYKGDPPLDQRDIYAQLAAATVHAALGDVDRAHAVLDRFVPRPPEPPAYAETVMNLHWARGEYDGALAWIEGEGARMLQEPWRGVLRAHALALVGRRESALALYRERFSDPGNRDLLATSSYAIHLGLGEIGNWVVLERESGADGAEGLAYLQGRIATMTRGGFGLPVLHYYRAVEAALRNDVATADTALGAAIAGGWLDPIAVDTDLAWRPFAEAGWFVQRRAELDAAVAAQREAISSG